MLSTSTWRRSPGLARAMTWKFAVGRVPYAGAKAGSCDRRRRPRRRSACYSGALEPFKRSFLTGPDMGTYPPDFVDEPGGAAAALGADATRVGMDDLATGHGVKAAAEAALAARPVARGCRGRDRGLRQGGRRHRSGLARAGARVVGVSTVHGSRRGSGRPRRGGPSRPREASTATRSWRTLPAACGPREALFAQVRRARAGCAAGLGRRRGRGSPPLRVVASWRERAQAARARGVRARDPASPTSSLNSGGVHLYESARAGAHESKAWADRRALQPDGGNDTDGWLPSRTLAHRRVRGASRSPIFALR